MIEELWSDLIEFTSQFVIPDWGALIALLPVLLLIPVFLYITWTIYRLATAGPKRTRQAAPAPRRAGRHPHARSVVRAVRRRRSGVFLLVFGLVAGGIWLLVGGDRPGAHAPLLGPRGAPRLRPHPRGGRWHGRRSGMLAAPAGTPPEGVHIPPPSFRPLLVAIGDDAARARAVVGGWG